MSDPAKSGEASSGVKSVTINGVEQKADSTYYSLPAPDGGNNDAGAEYTVVATDNAGNASTATVKIYRRHRVRVVSPDEQTTYAEAELAHNEYLVLTMKMPDGAAVRMTDKADHSEIPYDKEMGRFTVGLIDRSRTLVLEYNTEYPKAELILGRSQYFFGYNADTAEPHYLKDVSRKTDKNVYSVAVQINADVIPSHYFSSPVCYTQEELAELDKQGKIAWEKYQHPEPEPGVWIVYIPTATIDIAEYDANGSWYVYAKAENLKGTTYVSTPKLIADVEKPKAINLSTGKELETDGEYWGDLRFRVEAVSYTHLDVYKRQVLSAARTMSFSMMYSGRSALTVCRELAARSYISSVSASESRSREGSFSRISSGTGLRFFSMSQIYTAE